MKGIDKEILYSINYHVFTRLSWNTVLEDECTHELDHPQVINATIAFKERQKRHNV